MNCAQSRLDNDAQMIACLKRWMVDAIGASVMYMPSLHFASTPRLANRLPTDVFRPDYRLAPEHLRHAAAAAAAAKL